MHNRDLKDMPYEYERMFHQTAKARHANITSWLTAAAGHSGPPIPLGSEENASDNFSSAQNEAQPE